jgi:hypothetical protein
MLKNFFKVALRNLLKRKAYTLINILGLATGMAVCLLIVLFVQSELNYDKQHDKGKKYLSSRTRSLYTRGELLLILLFRNLSALQ